MELRRWQRALHRVAVAARVYDVYRRAADALGPLPLPIRRGALAGKTLAVRPSLARPAYLAGDYEPAVSAALLERAGPGKVCFDVGAHFGYFTLLMAARGACVHAFEPSPANFRALARTIAVNHLDHAHAHPLAVSACDGWEDLSITAASSMCRLRENARFFLRAGEGVVRTERVPVVSLDSFVARAGAPRVDLIKIDVEGEELRVLLGMQAIVRRWQPTLIIEVHRELATGEDPRAVLHLLRRWGYTCRDLGAGGAAITTFAHTWSEHHVLAEASAQE